MSVRLCGAACLAAVSALGLGARADTAPGWSELRGGGFVLRGAVPHGTLRALGCEVQAVAEALGPAGSQAVSGDGPLEILAVDNSRDARQLLPALFERRGARPLGAYWAGPHGGHIVVRVDVEPEERRRRILHEYAHFRVRAAHDRPPRWLDEGLAEFWEGASIRPDRIVVGEAVPAHVRTLRAKKWIPIDDLLSATSLPGDDKRLALFYAQSWALVRYLMMKAEVRDPFLARLPGNAELPAEDELRRFAGEAGGGFTIARAAREANCDEVAIRPLSRRESLVVRARALVDGDRPGSAAPLIQEALRLEAGDPAALETFGVLQFAGNRPQVAAAVFDRLISNGQGTHLAFYYRALLAGPVPDLSDGSGRVPVVDYLRRAVDLAPGFAPARERLQEIARREHLVGSPGL